MLNDKLYLEGDQNLQVPAHLNFGKFLLDRLLSKEHEVALQNADTQDKITYKELTQYAVDLSASLTRLGIGKGDVVALGSEKRIMIVPTALAVIFTGATYTPYALNIGRATLKNNMNTAQPKYLICTKLFWEKYCDVLTNYNSIKTFFTLDNDPMSAITVNSLILNNSRVDQFEPAPVEGQTDTALILYSSGTTGMPKGVQLTHLNCILHSLPDAFKDESLKTAFICGEWYHNYDIFMTFRFLSIGRTLVYINDITYEGMFRCFENYQVNIALLVPSIVSWIAKTDEKKVYNIDSLKIVYSRSSPIHVKTMERVRERYPKIKQVLQGYGMTEAGEPASETWGNKGPKPGSVGMASPGIKLKVVDPDTRKILGSNEPGEICLKGPVLMKGYIGIDPSAYLDEEGFYKTGDLGYYDVDGYIYIVERLKEILKYDGYPVAPLELETVLLLHQDVREAGVVGKPVPVYGEEPAAFVVRQPGSKVTEQELVDFVASEVAPYMQLRGGIRFISELPRNPRGKLLRRKLREILNDSDK